GSLLGPQPESLRSRNRNRLYPIIDKPVLFGVAADLLPIHPAKSPAGSHPQYAPRGQCQVTKPVIGQSVFGGKRSEIPPFQLRKPLPRRKPKHSLLVLYYITHPVPSQAVDFPELGHVLVPIQVPDSFSVGSKPVFIQVILVNSQHR